MRASRNVLIIITVAVALVAALALSDQKFDSGSSADAPVATPADVAPSAATSDVLPDDAPVLMVIGDSLSAGYGLADVSRGWVALLQQRLLAEDYEIRVVNASISGDTTRGGLARLPAALARFEPSLVVIELGANDGLRGFAPDEMAENLASMIELATQAGADVVLMDMMIPGNYGGRYTSEFQSRFTALAEQYSLPLVPFFLRDVALEPSLMQADDIHPNEQAQPIMLDAVWPVLEPELRQLESTVASTDSRG